MGALSGIRVVDFTRVVAGPYSTMLLGDLGAEVIKVERPGTGDDCRAWGPPFVGDDSAYFLGINRNKKSVALDLASEDGRRIARELVMESDVVVESFRPGVMDRFGLGYEELHAERRGLVYCSISAFGQDGPYRDRAGYDVMVSALGGLIGITGTPDGEPIKTGVALLDVATGLYAVQGILAALFHRERTGEGQRVDASLLSTQLSILINAASAYLLAGQVMQPQGSAHTSIVPYQAFNAADGYVMVGAANDKLFGLLAAEFGHPEWTVDPRFSSNGARVAHREELVPLINEALRSDTVANWVERLAGVGVAVAPVNRMDQVFADPQVQHVGQVVTVEHPTLGEVQQVGSALRLGVTPPEVNTPPPRLGEHTTEVLAELLGRDQQELKRLSDTGAIGDLPIQEPARRVS
jgi:crotonobetainyl-CoA:carnitine CoA-transferase CaiB-like acyl-CoA transferase